MTETIAFNIQCFVKRLTDCGFTERQAETLVDEHVAPLNANLATKVEIAKVDARVETVKSDLLRWMFGAMIVASVKLL